MTRDDELVAAQRRQRSRSFDAWAAEYDLYRPTYPQALFDHLATRLSLPADARVADVGAGTGKAARQMARRGWQVTAIEPGEGMLDILRARAAAERLAIDARLASAEETGLPDASVDLVTAAQAFHWFDKARALPEIERILRPAGGVAVFWNAPPDDRSPLMAAHAEALARYVPEAHLSPRERDREPSSAPELAIGGIFKVDEAVELHHEVVMTAQEFIGYTFTASQVRLFVEPDDQERLRNDLRGLVAEFGSDGSVVVPFDVDLYVAQRTAQGGGS